MNKKISIIKNSLLRQHEKIRKHHLEELSSQIKKDGFISDPIIVDKNTMIILDGHHRFNAIRQLGLTSSPVYLVNYKNRKIKVTSWRKGGEKITKKLVIKAGLSGSLLRPKTSKHFIPERPIGVKTSLSKLI
jgi:hypothetical protein